MLRSTCLGRAIAFASLATVLAGVGCRGSGKARDAGVDMPFVPEEIGRCGGFDPLRRPYFGDTHVHTRLSLDANLQGTRLGPDDAYRFAKGDAVGIQPYSSTGDPLRTIQLARPLDFAVVSDHAEFLALIEICSDPSREGYDHGDCATFRDNPQGAFFSLNVLLAAAQSVVLEPRLCTSNPDSCQAAAEDAWRTTRDAAEAHYDRSSACTFTTFVGYEWSGNPSTDNLHRNVVFRNQVVPARPTSYFDAPYPEQLWTALHERCIDRNDGCDALTIPHNSNLAGGRYFQPTKMDGQPIDRAYAEQRAFFEPLIEVFQHKGSSECVPGTTSPDELCRFEHLPFENLGQANLGILGTPDPRDFVRDALGEGLRLGSALGANPFRHGMIASTDTHIAAPGSVSESGFPGHGGAGRSNRDTLPPGLPDTVEFNPGGLAAVWAEENGREAIFLAMRRRETYGTSGPRIVLRFFGGFGYDDDLCNGASLVETGYAGGVPMGGVLDATTRAGRTPKLVVWAMRDAGTSEEPGTLLQRVQIVKGWLDAGEPRYQVFDVAGDPANGASVDPATCAPTGPGADELCTVWTDPAFDPTVPAFYYARVVENPTCRWHTRQCLAAGIDCSMPASVPEEWTSCCSPNVETFIQERAWSSPIWWNGEP